MVESQTTEQRLTTLENDFAKQKINLARLIGLPPSDAYSLSGEPSSSPPVDLDFDHALTQAVENRFDLKAAEAQLRAAKRTKNAATAERLPSLDVSADYGAIGTNPSQSHGTFTFVGTLRVPIWNGGKTEGSIEQADAALEQRRAELDDMRGRIEADVRQALLDLQTTRKQMDLAANNKRVARETLELTRQRFKPVSPMRLKWSKHKNQSQPPISTTSPACSPTISPKRRSREPSATPRATCNDS